MSHTAHRTNPARTLLLAGIGAFLLVLALVGGGSDVEPEVGGSDPGSGGGSSTYFDSGSLIETPDGELIYSDTDGNGFSTGG
jgi:hypothetical protein